MCLDVVARSCGQLDSTARHWRTENTFMCMQCFVLLHQYRIQKVKNRKLSNTYRRFILSTCTRCCWPVVEVLHFSIFLCMNTDFLIRGIQKSAVVGTFVQNKRYVKRENYSVWILLIMKIIFFVHYYKSLAVGDILFSGNQNTY